MRKHWRDILLMVGIVGVIASCLGIVVLGPVIGEMFFDRVSFNSVSWSPTGEKIAFLATLHTSTTSDFFYALYLVDADGDNLQNVTGAGSNIRTYRWSPDGQHLAVLENGGKLSIYSSESKHERDLNVQGITAVNWSLDGSRLAVMTSQENTYMLYLINADGSQQTLIYQGEGSSYNASLIWSPDQEKIAVRSGYTLMVVSTDGSQAQTLFDQNVTTSNLQWAGDKLTFDNAEGTFEIAASGGDIVRIADAPPYEPGVISPDGVWRAKVGCGDPDSEYTRNVDIFSCTHYELHVTRVSDDSMRFNLSFSDLKNQSSALSGLAAVVAFSMLVSPGLTLPYFYQRKNWLARFLMLAVFCWYGVIFLFFLGTWMTNQ